MLYINSVLLITYCIIISLRITFGAIYLSNSTFGVALLDSTLGVCDSTSAFLDNGQRNLSEV